ncbi:MAG TPA: SRPBCC domain-containing protein [Bacteroidota bacterium]|nr:SRPBCC domain-containing protein [Bacteroidota bacterium]
MATIIQKVVFKNATTRQLYNLYMDPKLHARISGGPVKISEKVGSRMEAHGGYITGKMLQRVKNKLIVHTWRGSNWSAQDGDSVFVVSFGRKGRDAVLHMTHANVPDEHAGHLDKGWRDHYWKPWKQYLSGKKITRPRM